MKKPFVRAFSIIQYFIQCKQHLTSMGEILEQENVNTEGIKDLDKWLIKWGIKLKPYN